MLRGASGAERCLLIRARMSMRASPRPRTPSPVARSGTRPASAPRPRTRTLVSWPAPPSPGSSVPPPAPAREKLATLDLADDDILEARDALEGLREAVGDPELLGGAWQAAAFCASALARTLGARAVLVHLHDRVRDELRTIAVASKKPNDLLGEVTSVDDDVVALSVVANRKPMVLRFEGKLPRMIPERLRKLGASRSLHATPVLGKDRCFALVEVVDPCGPLALRTAEATAFVAERLARVLSA